MSRRRIIRLEEYASSGPVIETIECNLQVSKPSKTLPKFSAAASHKVTEEYLSAFVQDPRLPRLATATDSLDEESKPVARCSTAERTSNRKMPAISSESTIQNRNVWLKGPNNPTGNVHSVSSQPLTCMSIAPDESEIVVGSCDHSLYGIPLRTTKAKGKNTRTYYGKTSGHGEWVTTVAHLPDGRVVSGGMDSKLCLWENNTRCEDLTGHSASISMVQAFEANTIISASYDKTYRLWDGSAGKRAAKNGRERHCLKGHDAAILDFHTWGSRLVGGDRNGNVLLFDLLQANVLKKAKGTHTGHCTAMRGSSHAPDIAFSGGQDGILKQWDARVKDPILSLACHSGKNGTGAVSFIRDVRSMEHTIITGGADGKVQVTDTRSNGSIRCTYGEHTNFIYSLHVAHDLCFSGSGNGMLLVHDLHTDRLCYGLGANQAAVRAIGTTNTHMIAAGDDGGVLVYEF